jgi:hypothetical protein
VEPGTKAAFMCLVGNEAKLSPACRTAVNAITTKSAAPAPAPPPAAAEAPPPGAAPEAPGSHPPPKAAAQEPKGDQRVQSSRPVRSTISLRTARGSSPTARKFCSA